MKYNELSDKDKIKLIKDKYVKQGLSFAELAKSCDTYANKIRRDAAKFEIPIRTKSAAQKNVLKKGKSKHPTKGKKRSSEEKRKIGKALYESWNNLSQAERDKRCYQSAAAWSNLSDDEKMNRMQAANAAVRESSRTGSKLEKFLLKELISNNYKVEFHKEQILSNTKLQIDLYLPEFTTAIEVDGPSHFAPVWGEEALKKNIKYDNKKTGLILGRGMRLVRIKQSKDFSPARGYVIFDKLLKIIDKIKRNDKSKIFNIEDE